MASASRTATAPAEEVKNAKDVTSEQDAPLHGLHGTGNEPVVLKDMDGNEIKIN